MELGMEAAERMAQAAGSHVGALPPKPPPSPHVALAARQMFRGGRKRRGPMFKDKTK
jgi:hypothetical protein